MGVHGLARSAESPLSLLLSPAPREAAEQASPHLGCLCRGPGSRGPRARAWLGSCAVRSRRGGGRGNAAPSVSRAAGLSASQAAPWVVWLPSPPPPWPETPDRGPVPRPPVRFAARETWQEGAARPAPPASPPARIPRDAGARGPPSAAGRMASGLARGPYPVRVPPETCRPALPPPGPTPASGAAAAPGPGSHGAPGPPKGRQHGVSRRAPRPLPGVPGPHRGGDGTRTGARAHVFLAAVVMVSKGRKPPSVRDRRTGQPVGSVRAGDYYAATKRSAVPTFAPRDRPRGRGAR